MFKKKIAEVVVDYQKQICIVYNAVNHESFVGAAVAASYLQEVQERSVLTCDVREALPQADYFIWLDAGTAKDYRSYYAANLGSPKDLKAHAGWLDALEAKSLYFQSIEVQGQEPMDLAVGQYINSLSFEYNHASEMANQTIASIHRYHSPLLSKDDACDYDDVLTLAAKFHKSGSVDIIHLGTAAGRWISTNREKLAIWQEKEKQNSQMLHTKYREVAVGEKSRLLINTTDHEVYSLIRRAVLAKREIVHLSSGTYGQVLYSLTAVDPKLYGTEKLLNLSAQRTFTKSW